MKIMKKRTSRLFGRIFLTICLLLNSTFAYPYSTPQKQTPTKSPSGLSLLNSTQNRNTDNNQLPTDAFSLNSSQLGWMGPLSFGINRDSLLNYSWNAQYTQKFGDNFALSGLLEYGSDTFRINGTVGFNLFQKGLVKVTGERLAQKLPFTFDSGSVNQKMYQNAVGARYQYGFDSKIFQDINFGGYYANTPSKWLDPVYFMFQGANAINYRHIAGAKSGGFDLGTDVKLTTKTGLSGHLYYDTVNYNTVYASATDNNKRGIGGGLGLNQLIGDRLLVAAEGSVREIYNTYKLSVSWLPPFATKFPFEFSLVGQRLISHNQTPNSNSLGLKLTFNPSLLTSTNPHYELPNPTTINDIVAWTSTPAVHMDQVLAIADQLTVILAPIITAVNPASATIFGGTQITITGANLAGAKSVTFDGVPAVFSVLSANTIVTTTPPHLAGAVTLAVTGPGGTAKTNFLYTVVSDGVPVIKSITPAQAPITGAEVTIVGDNFEQHATVAFGDKTKLGTVKSVEKTKIVVVAPKWEGTPGRVDVIVTNPGADNEAAILKDGFTYTDTANFRIDSLEPASGGPNKLVKIHGSGFDSKAVVAFGGVVGTNTKVVSATEIDTKIPANTNQIGNVDVKVTDSNGTTALLKNGFNISPDQLPQITIISPNWSESGISVPVVLTGSNFLNAEVIEFGPVILTPGEFNIDSDTQITIPSNPPGSGTVTVVVRNTDGPSNAVDFTYDPAERGPVVRGINPSSGQAGSAVDIIGENFGSGGTECTAYFGDVATQPGNCRVNDANLIQAIAPNGTGSVPVVITTANNLTSAQTQNAIFTYTVQPRPSINSVTPAGGPLAGGNSVTITGSSFTGATSVTFNGIAATVTSITETKIVATAPASAVSGSFDVQVTTPGGASPITAADKYLYSNDVMVTSVTPSQGASGITVTLGGNSFTGATAVTFGTVDATTFSVTDDTHITATVPAQAITGQVNVTVTKGGVISPILDGSQFTYVTLPTVTGLTPSSGSPVGGNQIQITGTGFLTATAVTFGSLPATQFGIQSDTTIIAMVPAKGSLPDVVDVRVTNPAGTSAIVPADQYTYVFPQPVVTSVSPGAGPTAGGGTQVTITGIGFTGATAVTFGSDTPVPEPDFVILDDNHIRVTTVPAHAAGTVDVQVTTPGGTSATSTADQYIYSDGVLVTEVNPASGGAGITVTIFGYSFTGATAVTFGTVAATAFTVTDDTHITATVPAQTPSGPVDVRVTKGGVQSPIISGDRFTYITPPTVTSIVPSTGPTGGGTSVEIHGTGFGGATSVAFGPTTVGFSIASDTVIHTIAPPGVQGAVVDVRVSNSAGQSPIVPQDQYTYSDLPSIASIGPTTGSAGSLVLISGSNLSRATSVTFGNAPVTAPISVTPEGNLSVVVPTKVSSDPNAVHVTVITPFGQATSAQTFTYEDVPPTITNFTPTSGPLAGGTSVTINGSNFDPNATVRFNGLPATVTSGSANQLICTTPVFDHAAAVSVKVTNPSTGLTATAGSDFQYTNVTVLGISPGTGPATGGTAVTITGTNFVPGSVNGVFFIMNNGQHFVQAANTTVKSSTEITCITPPAPYLGAASIQISFTDGTSITLPNAFTFAGTPAPYINSISPNNGPLAGGTQIGIDGVNFVVPAPGVPGTTVTINSSSATCTVQNPTSIICTTPPGPAPGYVPITVTNPDGQNVTQIDAFAYTAAPPPTLTGISPNSEPTTGGGQTVLVTGVNFTAGATVTIGGYEATQVQVLSSTQIQCKTPPVQYAGTFNVIVTNLDHQNTEHPPQPPVPITYTYGNIIIPIIYSVSPTSGPISGGTGVTLSGGGFSTVTAVNFVERATGVSHAAQSFSIDSDSRIYAVSPVVPASNTGAYDIEVIAPTGTSTHTDGDKFNYLGVTPSIYTVSPTSGDKDTPATAIISGINFSKNATVTFGGLAATVDLVSDDGHSITCITPTGHAAGKVDVVVTNPGPQSATAVNAFTFTNNNLPTVTAVSPNHGSTAGGELVTVQGTNFVAGNANTKVFFGGVQATNVNVSSSTQLTCTSPANANGTVDVSIVTDNGQSINDANSKYEYYGMNAPIIYSMSPNSGPTSGGTIINISGEGFTGATGANAVVFDFNGTIVPATSYTVNSDSSLTVTSPALPALPTNVAASAHIIITTSVGTSAQGVYDQFFYTPLTVHATAGANGTITPSGDVSVAYGAAQSFDIHATPGSGYQIDTIFVNGSPAAQQPPPGSTDYTFNLENITANGTTVNVTFKLFAPGIISLNPVSGPLAGGTHVDIIGMNFVAGATVKFGNNAATGVNVISANEIDCVAPAGSSAGPVDVVVTNIDQQSSNPQTYTYVAVPTVTQVNPNIGPTSGGTSVTITGTNLTGATAVNFGATAATSFTVDSDTQITATSPAGIGTVDVRVTTVGGTSATSSADQFTYIAAPTVTNVNPGSGPESGGTSVIITGTNFIEVTAVKFGTVDATTFHVDSATQITATSPAGTDHVDVTVTAIGGTSATSTADHFIYVPKPTVTSINPTSGPTAGGTSVTITGTDFTGATAVNFGAVAAASFHVDSATRISAISPAGTGTVDVTVTAIGGTSTTSAADQFTYVAAPTVTGISPTAGPTAGGTLVTITGTNFTGATAVKFGTTAATAFHIDSPTQITATSPAGTGIVDVTVTTVGGTSATSAADQFTYVAAPTVTGVSPISGPQTGGTSVTITGTNFNGATAVHFGAAAVTTFTVDSDTQITATSPAGVGTVDVTVTTVGGTSATSAADQFTYVPAPTVTTVNPTAGPTTGGTAVTITGTNFTGATAIHFGAVIATAFHVDSATQITATSPAGTGTVDITVTTLGGTSATSAADQFTYVSAPTVTGVSPTSGPAAGGTSVTITGTNFIGATVVNFGTTAATSFHVDSATQITATSPAGTGLVDITVTTPGGTSATSAADQFAYIPAPTVTNVNPTTGPTAGGTTVIITGTNFPGTTAVNFGGTAAASFHVDSATQITATSPAGTGTVDITVTTGGGTSATSSADQFTYVAAPTVTSVSPTSGPESGGTSVIITGTNFTGATAVKFGVTNATSFTVDSATQITAISPSVGASPTPVDITVTTVGGTSATSDNDKFTFTSVVPPIVTNVNPNIGPTAGGTSVIITGERFTGATAVNFGGTAAASFTVDSATQITAVSPVGTAGTTVDITVTTPGGTSATSGADRFTYVAVPTVTNVNPTVGPTAGGTTVTITGTSFIGVSAVNFGATPATSFHVDSATQITAISPAGAGTVDIRVTTVGGTSATSVADQFTYVVVPTVTSVSPTTGPTIGGTSVTVTGTNFTGATAVKFGTTAATSFHVDSATQITAVSPVNAVGTIDITVTTAGGTSATSAADQFTYIAVPTVTNVSPNAGPTVGGTAVTIVGTNFTGATAVNFGGTAATSFHVDSATQITATSPAGTGTVDITVTTIGGTSATSAADQFTYVAAPTVTNVSPVSGPTAGGTTVTITGTNLTGATAVNFGATAATTFHVDSATQITATSPARTAGTVDITVTTAGGTSATSAADQFTYVAAPTVTNVSPTSGPTTGGTTVTITGTNFTGATAVSFDGTAATSFHVDSATQITATSPARTAGTVDITVTTPGGTSTTSAADRFTYVPLPTITGVDPESGPEAGGTSVTITGTNFTGATAVNFGATPATSFHVDSDTQITATSPAGSGHIDITVTSIGGTSAITTADHFIYVSVPTVTNVSPTAGPTVGGTSVAIIGTNFTGATAVNFGATAATTFHVDSATHITATSPAGTGTVDVTVTTAGGTSATSAADHFTYVPAPTVTAISPTSGPEIGGTSVVITGTNFTGASAVNFGATAATAFHVDSATQITATSPAGVGVVDVTVITVGGTSATSGADRFTYVPAPRIDKLTPNFGPQAGGNVVDIQGAHFSNVGGLPTVLVGGKPATNIDFESSTDVDFTAPAKDPASPDTVDVTIINPDGQSFTAPGAYSYVLAPTVTLANPNHGPSTGQTPVTINGTNFRGGAIVAFGGVAATNVQVISETRIDCVTQARAPGLVNVVVTNLDGQSGTLVNGYTYDSPPSVTSVSPIHGPSSGGTPVTVTGTNFVTGATVSFGGALATNVTVVSSTQINCTTSSRAAGLVNVQVTNPDTQTGTLINGYTYDPAPSPTAVSPTHGPSTGGTPVTITGTSFVTGATVSFGGTPATNVQVVSATQITCVTQAHTPGIVDVVVTNPDGQSGTLIGGYTFDPPPVVTSVFPDSGTTQGGTPVSISGANFVVGAGVTFGGAPATGVVVVSSGLITCNTPAHVPGPVSVTITNPDGQSGTKTNAYTYVTTHTILATAGTGGTIFPSGAVQVNDGDSKTFTINPNPHYQIADVLVDGQSVGAVSTYIFNNVTANHTIEARFAVILRTINATAGTGGTINPSGNVTVTDGNNQTFTIAASAGFNILDVKVDGSSVGPVTSYTFINVTANHSIAATFVQTHTITASAGTGGIINPSGAVVVVNGANKTFTISPASGFAIQNVVVDGATVGAVSTYTFTNVTANHTITATFAPIGQVTPPSFDEANNPSLNPGLMMLGTGARIVQGTTSSSPITLSLNQGSTNGGQIVVLTFSNFKKLPTRVTFGGIPAKIISVGYGRVVVQIPPHAAGKVDVVISNASERVVGINVFTYTAP